MYIKGELQDHINSMGKAKRPNRNFTIAPLHQSIKSHFTESRIRNRNLHYLQQNQVKSTLKQPEKEHSFLKKTGHFLVGQATDFVGSSIGAAAGELVGSPFGPLGAFIGGVIGSSVGSTVTKKVMSNTNVETTEEEMQEEKEEIHSGGSGGSNSYPDLMDNSRGPDRSEPVLRKVIKKRMQFVVHQIREGQEHRARLMFRGKTANISAAWSGHYYVPDNVLSFYIQMADIAELGAPGAMRVLNAGWKTTRQQYYRFTGSTPGATTPQYTALDVGTPSLYIVDGQVFNYKLPGTRILSWPTADTLESSDIPAQYVKPLDNFETFKTHFNNNFGQMGIYNIRCKHQKVPMSLPSWTWPHYQSNEATKYEGFIDKNEFSIKCEHKLPITSGLIVRKTPIKAWRSLWANQSAARAIPMGDAALAYTSATGRSQTTSGNDGLLTEGIGFDPTWDYTEATSTSILGKRSKVHQGKTHFENMLYNWTGGIDGKYSQSIMGFMNMPIGYEKGMGHVARFYRPYDATTLHQGSPAEWNAPTLLRLDPTQRYENYDPKAFLIMDIETEIELEFNYDRINSGLAGFQNEPIDHPDWLIWKPIGRAFHMANTPATDQGIDDVKQIDWHYDVA